MNGLAWWCVVAGYGLLAIGTARWVFAHEYVSAAKAMHANLPYTYANFDDAMRDAKFSGLLWTLTVVGGLFWPVIAVFGGVANPVCRTVFPLVGKWWMAPANKEIKRRSER